jgi:hypothetical protein
MPADRGARGGYRWCRAGFRPGRIVATVAGAAGNSAAANAPNCCVYLQRADRDEIGVRQLNG